MFISGDNTGFEDQQRDYSCSKRRMRLDFARSYSVIEKINKKRYNSHR